MATGMGMGMGMGMGAGVNDKAKTDPALASHVPSPH
eukprot:COSAG03_NODE_6284_length_1084_cov_1.032487_3_plen_35_part_01